MCAKPEAGGSICRVCEASARVSSICAPLMMLEHLELKNIPFYSQFDV